MNFTMDKMTTKVSNTRTACFQPRSVHRRSVVLVKAEAQASKREVLKGLFGASLVFATVSKPAQAGLLGISSPEEKADEYKTFTGEVIADVQAALKLDKEDPGRGAAIEKAREQTTKWVAKYRRDGTFQGRPSYGNTYSALSALAGHYNNFGPDTNVPKKRLDRLSKELVDAQKLLERNR